jgi:transcriptional regulator with XRE-family HTH domain
MIPADLKSLRRALGLSLADFARAVGFVGEDAARKVRAMEDGQRPIPGSLAVALRYMAQAVDFEDDATAADRVAGVLPRWLDCSDLEDAAAAEIVMHTRWPRFFAFVRERLPDDLADALRAQSVPVLHLPDAVGGDSMTFIFIDQPVDDPSRLLIQARDLKTAQARRDLGLG